MPKQNFINYLLNPKNWWLPLLIIFTISIAGVTMIGIHTYTEAPPIPDYVSKNGGVVFSKDDVLKGQAVFQKYALMEYGTMFGDGALRGPDYTAEALHQVSQNMNSYYTAKLINQPNGDLLKKGIGEQVKAEIKTNNYDKDKNTVVLSDGQVYGAGELINYYTSIFTDTSTPGAFKPGKYITDKNEIRELAAFFFWGSWVCGVERPGENYSYTHNWPYDPVAGNTPSPAIMLWSIIGSLGLIFGLGIILYYYGKMDQLNDKILVSKSQPFMDKGQIKAFQPTNIQRATYKFFYAAILLFAVQVLAGVLTVHDFVDFVHFFGFNISIVLPETITRSWHVQLSLLWISACWIGGSFFMMALVSPKQPSGQVRLINTLFWLTIMNLGLT